MPEAETAESLTVKGRRSRFNEILTILIRNNAWSLSSAILRGKTPPEDAEPAPVRLRRILEQLGPTFIKLGQLLATRPDLIEKEYVEEFRKLYDRAPASSPGEVARIIRSELGREASEVFAAFNPIPIASASIGQVHEATLQDGRRVAVKVQHAGIEDAMESDFRILRRIVTFVEKTVAGSRIWQPSDHLEELRLMLERELDYRYEMRNAQRIAAHFADNPNVHIPVVMPELSTKRVLVMEFLDGVKLTSPLALSGVDGPKVARTITEAMAKQIFVDRIFHADPSPGNILILPGNVVAFLDFGAVGVVTERRARTILQLVTAIGGGHTDATADAIIDLCDQRADVDLRRFRADVEKILEHFERSNISVADPVLMDLIVGLARAHRMLLPADFALITRALFQFEGICRTLDPQYELVKVLDPFVANVAWKSISSPTAQKELIQETLTELLKFGRTLPHTLNTVLRKVERNEITTRVDIVGVEGIKQAHGRGVLKTSFTVMAAALVVGLAWVYASPVASERIGQFLFAAGAVVVGWILVMVLWSEGLKGNRD